MNYIKKSIAFVTIALLVLTFCATASLAADFATDYGLTSSNSRVQVLADRIAVYSHSTRVDGSLPISSSTLLSALTSSKGYEIAYTDIDKNETTSVSVKEGFIKLTKDSEEIYLPISKKGDAFAPSSFADKAWYVSNSAGAGYNAAVGGIGGKGEDEVSAVFVANEPLASFSRVELPTKVLPFTIEFNVYADGDAIARANYRYSDDKNQLFRWEADGTFKYNADGTLTSYGKVERAQWHKVAITYDEPRGRYLIYLDGKRLTENGSPYFRDATKIMLGISQNSANGKVACSDLEGYYGYYYPAEAYTNITLECSCEGATIENKVIKIDPSKVTDLSSLASSFATNADEISIYTDNTFTEKASDIENAGALVLCDTQTKSYSYYTIKLLNVEVDSVVFENDGTSVCAKASLSYEGTQQKTATLVMVLKDSDGRICRVVTSQTDDVGASTQLQTPSVEHNGLKAEAFILNDWNLREELSDKIYFEEE